MLSWTVLGSVESVLCFYIAFSKCFPPSSWDGISRAIAFPASSTALIKLLYYFQKSPSIPDVCALCARKCRLNGFSMRTFCAFDTLLSNCQLFSALKAIRAISPPDLKLNGFQFFLEESNSRRSTYLQFIYSRHSLFRQRIFSLFPYSHTGQQCWANKATNGINWKLLHPQIIYNNAIPITARGGNTIR